MDYGAAYTDQKIKEVDDRIKDIYKEAAQDIDKKMDEFNAKYKVKEQKYQQKVNSGEMTQEEFDHWKEGQVFQGKQWQAKKEEIATVLHNSNIIASNIVNNESMGVFITNGNYASYQMEHDTGVNFGFALYDQHTVAKLIKDEPNLLPQYTPKKAPDMNWNTKKITRQITQGIIQGESLDQIAKRLATATASQNMNSMKTHARTLMTGAQNAGRLSSYESAEKLGIDLEKQWMATLDAHTRDSHKGMDGETAPIKEEFSNGLMYPGDPAGLPKEVYNCRCTMVSDVKKYPAGYNRYDNISGKKIKNMSYKDWEDAKKQGKDISPVPLSFKHYKDKSQQALVDAFGGKTMSGLYNDIKDFDKVQANKFYKTLGEGGKPSETWSKYLDGTLDDNLTKKIDDILNEYGLESGAITPPVDLKAEFNGKSMSSVYNDMKAVDTKMANEFYKDLKGMGKPSEVWGDYLKGNLSETDAKKIEKSLDKYMGGEANKMVKPGSVTKPISTGDPLKDAQLKLQEAEAKASAVPHKEFPGIWKDKNPTYADYESLKDKIQSKKDYYNDMLTKDWVSDAAKKDYVNKLLQLDDFEKNGKAYAKLFKDVEDAKAEVAKHKPVNITGKGFDSKAYDTKTKADSKSFSNGKSADKYYRPELDKQWKNVSDKEKYSVWEYTRNSNPINKPLSGYHDSWSRSDFIGMDKTDWGHEDKWRSLGSNFKKYGENGHVTYKEVVTDLTKAIDKCEMKDNVNLVRGSDKNGLAGILEGNLFSFDDAKKLLNKDEKTIKAALEGQVFQNHAFTSTGIAKGTGFTGDVMYEIYAPKGTHALYAEPQSYFGSTISGEELYTAGQSYHSVGHEAEVILQRGTEFRITEIEKIGSGDLKVKMEIVGQPDYFKFGDEDTFNAGKTRHKK